MSIVSDWATERCEKHDMTSCADCLESAKARREGAEVRYQDDCCVATLVEILGLSYAEASETLLAAGFVPGKGTPAAKLEATFRDFGFAVVRRGVGRVTARGTRTEGMTFPEARAASVDGRLFYAIGADRSGAHAWSILDGKVNRAFLRAPYVYGILEVTA